MLPRLKTAEQFAAVMDASKQKSVQPAGVWRSAHFALHMAPLSVLSATAAPIRKLTSKADSKTALEMPSQAPATYETLFETKSKQSRLSSTTVGVICPKRWAKRAVTRNTIKRQIYAVSSELQAQLPAACIVLRLASGFSSEQFTSATSTALKRALREELLSLLGKLPRISTQMPHAAAQEQTIPQEQAT